MRRCRRRVGRLELSCAVVTIGLLLGGSVSLDRKGVPVSGRGAAKLERIAVSREPSGDWDRHYEVTAAFELPNGGASQATVRVPPEQPGVAHGALLPVRLDPAAPRDAHLAVGTRRFVEANRYHFLTPVLGCGILGMLAALAYRWRRPKRQATTGDETMARQEGRIMETKMPALSLMIALLSTPPESRLAAQDQAPADSIHACDLVTNADVEKVTRRRTQGASGSSVERSEDVFVLLLPPSRGRDRPLFKGVAVAEARLPGTRGGWFRQGESASAGGRGFRGHLLQAQG